MSDERPGDHAFTAETLTGAANEPTYSGALSFLRRKYTRDLEGVDVAVTGVPFDLATTNRPGARFGPQAVRRASAHMAWAQPWPWPSDPFDRLAVVDTGDCVFDFGRPETIPDAIEAHARRIIEQGPSLLTIGGDHFITYPLLKAHVAKHGPLSLVHFDAHRDSDPDPGPRVDHGTMFFHAAKDGLVSPEHSAQIGIRTHQDDSIGFNILDARWVHRNGPEAVAAEVKRIVGDRKAYLTFDIDCLDPAFAPGTGTPVPGGLSSFQALEILRGLVGLDFVAMDVVEVAPAYDISDITALAAATLAAEYLCLRAATQG